MQLNLPIVILAAGGSTRMRGDDKLLKIVDGMPLLRRQALRALATQQPVYVALRSQDDPRQPALRGLDVKVLCVAQASEGMSGTLRGAVAQLPTSSAFMIMLADLVAIDSDDLQKVITAYSANPDNAVWRGATAKGKPGHPIIFDDSLRPLFAQLTGDRGAEALVSPLQSKTHLVPLEGRRARLDLDTPEDWQAWEEAQSTT